MTNLEIERKFLLSEAPAEFLSGASGEEILQGYLIVDQNRELRIRRRGQSCWMTLKQGDGLARYERECRIADEQFDMLWPLTEGRRVEKTRYAVENSSLTYEIDIFSGALAPLIMLEIEFDSIQASADFTPPESVIKEVTEDKNYKNASLALRGLPEQQ